MDAESQTNNEDQKEPVSPKEETKTPSAKPVKSMIFLDIVLAVGLLVCVGVLAVGLFKMYIMHAAERCIAQQNYQDAIAVLKNNAMPGLFAGKGSDGHELMNQALYLDAMDKLESESDIGGALQELQLIEPGSRYYPLTQEIIIEYNSPVTSSGKE